MFHIKISKVFLNSDIIVTNFLYMGKYLKIPKNMEDVRLKPKLRIVK